MWRIFRFQQRFELKEDVRFCRSGPLIFIREYVGSGQDDEAIKYKQQIAVCESAPNRCELLYVFWKLREIAANHSRAYRGYLLDERFEPANISKIAVWIGFEAKKTERIMRQLEQIGLIEYVSLPNFDLSVNEPPNRIRKSSRAHKPARARTRKPERARAPLKKKGKARSGKRNIKRNKKSGRSEPDKTKKQKKAKAQPNPMNPTESDRGVGQACRIVSSDGLPCRSIKFNRKKGPERLGSVVQKLLQPPECLVFAAEVYKAIGTPYPLDSNEGKSEIGCWQSAWSKALLAGLSYEYLRELYDKVIKEAERLKLKRHRIKFRNSPEAVLRDMFDKMLMAKKRQAKQADPVSEMSLKKA